MNNELAKLKELQPGIWGMMAGSTNPRTGKMVLAETEMLHLLEFVNLVPDAVEAAEARIAELTADLDKESEIHHRIHEELNAIKGAQQPVAEIKWNGSELIVQNVSDAFSFGVTEVYTHPAPAVLPPEITFEYVQELGEYCYCSESFAKGANWMRQQVLDMGAKSVQVVELPNLANIHANWGEDYMLKSDVIDMLKAAGVKCEEKS